MSESKADDANVTIKFAIDRGGTFTDVYAALSDGRTVVTKLLSVNPTEYADAPVHC